MRVREASIFPLSIPLRIRFSQANSEASTSRSLIFVLTTVEGVRGYGECCPRMYVTGENLASVSVQLEKLVEKVTLEHFDSVESLITWLDNISQDEMGLATRCALETALLDAWGKTNEQSLYAHFAIQPQDMVRYAGVLPLSGGKNMDKVLGMIGKLGFGELKMKVGRNLQETLDTVATVRSLLPRMTLRMDVNEAWDLHTAREHLPALIEAGVQVFEQPFPKGQEPQMEPLMKEFGGQTCFMADESATCLASVQSILHHGWFHRLNLKLSKQGGFTPCLRAYTFARAKGVSCQLGAHFGETAILTALGLLFSAAVPELTSMEGGLGTLLLERDVSERPLQLGPKAYISEPERRLAGPGLGLRINTEAFELA